MFQLPGRGVENLEQLCFMLRLSRRLMASLWRRTAITASVTLSHDRGMYPQATHDRCVPRWEGSAAARFLRYNIDQGKDEYHTCSQKSLTKERTSITHSARRALALTKGSPCDHSNTCFERTSTRLLRFAIIELKCGP